MSKVATSKTTVIHGMQPKVNSRRLGPVLQLQVNAPRLAFGKDITLTALYSHLRAISGPDDTESYFKAVLTYTLLKNEALNHRVSLNAEYEKGPV